MHTGVILVRRARRRRVGNFASVGRGGAVAVSEAGAAAAVR